MGNAIALTSEERKLDVGLSENEVTAGMTAGE